MSVQAPAAPRTWWRQMTSAAGARLAVLPVTAAAALATARVTIEATGAEVYGYIALIGQLFMLFQFSDLGIGAAMTRAVAREELGERERRLAEATVWRGWILLSAVAAVGVTATIAVGATIGWDAILGVPAAHAEAANAATTAALSLFLALLPVSSSRRILVGQDRTTVMALLGGIPSLVGLAAAVVMAVADAPVFAFALAPTVGVIVYDSTCFAVAVRAGSARDALRRLRPSARVVELPQVRILAVASSMLVLTLANAALIQGTRIVLSHRGDAAQLTEHSLALQLYLPLWSVIYMASTVLWSRFSIAAPDRRLAARTNGALAGLGAAAGLGLLLLGPALTSFMSGGRVAASAGVLASFAVLLTVLGTNATQAMWFTDAEGLRFQAVCAVIAVALALPLSWSLIGTLGTPGAALGAAIGALVAQTLPGLARAARLTRTSAVAGGAA